MIPAQLIMEAAWYLEAEQEARNIQHWSISGDTRGVVILVRKGDAVHSREVARLCATRATFSVLRENAKICVERVQ